jgi:hypothetical protein
LFVETVDLKARFVETESKGKKKAGTNYNRQIKSFRKQLVDMTSIPQK